MPLLLGRCYCASMLQSSLPYLTHHAKTYCLSLLVKGWHLLSRPLRKDAQEYEGKTAGILLWLSVVYAPRCAQRLDQAAVCVIFQVCNICLLLRRDVCLSRCAIEEFKRSSDSWRSHAKTTAALRSEFAELLGDAEEPAQDAQPGPGKQQDANAAPSSQLLAGHTEEAELPKPKKAKKSKKTVSTQPGQHDITGKPDKHEMSEAPVAVSEKPKKRQKGARALATGSAPAAADMHAKQSRSAAAVEPELFTDGPAATHPKAKVAKEGKSKKHHEKGLAGSAAESNMPVATENRIGKKKKKQQMV